MTIAKTAKAPEPQQVTEKSLPFGYVKLKNVRLSYPTLFHRVVYIPDGNKGKFVKTTDGSGKFKTSVLLDKSDTEVLNQIKTIFNQLEKKNETKVRQENKCIKDGDNETDNEFSKGCWCISASSGQRVQIVDRDGKTPIVEQDNKVYGGVYVNVVLSFYFSNNRLNAGIAKIQFVKDGPNFGAAPVNLDDIFEPVELDSKPSVVNEPNPDDDIPF